MVQQQPFDISYPATCENFNNDYTTSDYNRAGVETLKTVVLMGPLCTILTEEQLTFILGDAT